MSAGAFVNSRYQLDDTAIIVPVKVQQETIDFTDGSNANDPPGGAVTLSVSARTRKGNREYGIGCRSVTISWNSGAPTGYEDENLTIPILTPAVYNGYNVGDTVTYLGTAATIVGKKNEQLR